MDTNEWPQSLTTDVFRQLEIRTILSILRIAHNHGSARQTTVKTPEHHRTIILQHQKLFPPIIRAERRNHDAKLRCHKRMDSIS